MPSLSGAKTPKGQQDFELRALVAAAFGRHYEVWLDGDPTRRSFAVTRGKKTEVCVGDWARISITGIEQSVIELIEPRKNEIKRSDAFRTKWIAANIDLAVLVIAVDPPFSDEVVTRVRCASTVADVPLLVLINKSDLLQNLEPVSAQRLKRQIAEIEGSDALTLHISAKHENDLLGLLRPHLENKTSLLLGQSGMGKSTVLNRLVPHAKARTQEISQVLGSGKHTTTHSQMFCLDEVSAGFNARLIDSPGFQAFGLGHLSKSQLQHAMPEFENYLGNCRFSNCKHYDEPQCAVREALKQGQIGPARYNAYKTISQEIEFIDRARLQS
jgi:ribosome biogenesis GTPase / thiamine phosphate phosphatase